MVFHQGNMTELYHWHSNGPGHTVIDMERFRSTDERAAIPFEQAEVSGCRWSSQTPAPVHNGIAARPCSLSRTSRKLILQSDPSWS